MYARNETTNYHKNKIIANREYIIVDLDGTLIDTDEANFFSYRDAVKKVKNLDVSSLCEDTERFTREKLYYFDCKG